MSTPRETPASHDLAANVVVLRKSSVLVVYEKNRWGLPKGSSEPGEFFFETVTRETAEETGIEVKIQPLAFTGEIRALGHRIYFQRFYRAMPVADDPMPSPSDPDDEIEVVEFLPLTTLESTLTYRSRIEPPRDWFQDCKPRHYTYDLTREPLDVEK